MEVKKLDMLALAGKLDILGMHLADLRRMLFDLRGPATVEAARLQAKLATDELTSAKGLLEQMQAPRAWCDGCGDGAPGTMEHLTRGEVPCVVCGPQDEGFA